MPAGVGYGQGLLSNPLLGAGIGLLDASGPSPFPVGIGQALRGGLLGGREASAFGLAQQGAEQRQQLDAARIQEIMDDAKLEQDAIRREEAEREAIRRLLGPAGQAPGGAPQRGAPQAAGLLAQQGNGFSMDGGGVLSPGSTGAPQEPQLTAQQAQLRQLAILTGDPAHAKAFVDSLKRPDATSLQRHYEQAKQEGFPGSFLEYQLKLKEAGGVTVENNLGGGFEPQSTEGKLVSDLAGLQKLPPSPERDIAMGAIRKKLNSLEKKGAEETRSETKMRTVSGLVANFDRLATEAEKDPSLLSTRTGPIRGRVGRMLTSMGFGDSVDGSLNAMEAQMKSQLGTALSGAAIPEQEWPTYQAQVPSRSDSPAIRKGKIASYAAMMLELEKASKGARTPDSVKPTNPTLQPGATIDPSSVGNRALPDVRSDAEIMRQYGVPDG